MSDTIGRDVRFVLPEDPAVPRSINSGVPAVLFETRSAFARSLRSLIGTLAESDEGLFEDSRATAKRERRIRIPGVTQ
jgi:MinD-like ATPase involved in chromosome partitioning or flagellar assembly